MVWAQFEEKEYEAPLYNQLEAGHLHVWAPGQVFEHWIGFDRGVFVRDPFFWQHIGYKAIRRGSVFNRYDFPLLNIPDHRPLPNFRLNLFIQAKRPKRLKRIHQYIRTAGVNSPCYKIKFELDQHEALFEVSQRLGYHSYVCYSAPVFHTLEQLYFHTRQGSIIGNSSFPEVRKLGNHEAWFYNLPGAIGVADSDPEFIDDPDLFSKIEELGARETDLESDVSENLSILSNTIITSIESSELRESPRRSAFFNQLNLIDSETGNLDYYRSEIRNFLKISQFALTYNVEWYVIG